MSAPSRFASYQRVSSRKQSFERQEREATRFCHRNGFELVAAFRDFGNSGYYTPAGRKGWRQLVEAVGAGGIDAVYCGDIFRVTRDPSLLADTEKLAALLPVPIVSDFDGFSSCPRLHLWLMGTDEVYRANRLRLEAFSTAIRGAA